MNLYEQIKQLQVRQWFNVAEDESDPSDPSDARVVNLMYLIDVCGLDVIPSKTGKSVYLFEPEGVEIYDVEGLKYYRSKYVNCRSMQSFKKQVQNWIFDDLLQDDEFEWLN